MEMSDKEKKLDMTYPNDHEVVIENNYVDDPMISDN